MVRNIPFIIFPCLTIVPVAIIHFRAQRAFSKATCDLENEHRKLGKTWDYATDVRTQVTLLNQDGSWIKSDEEPSIQNAKRTVLQQRQAIGRTFKPMLTILLIGLALSAVAAVFTRS
jgi:hypothetical protein